MLSILAKNLTVSNRQRFFMIAHAKNFSGQSKKVLTRIYDPKVDYYKVLKVT